MDLLIVIVNYRTGELVVDCLRSIASQIRDKLPTMRVVIVDNASPDDSAQHIENTIAQQGWQTWAGLDRVEQNGGFAAGNNAAIGPALESAAPPRYFLLLNPDTLVRSDGLVNLVRFMDEHPDVGIAGSRLEFPDGTPQCSAFRFHSAWSELDAGLRLGPVTRLLKRWVVALPVHGQPHRTDWVSGAAMVVRREVFEAIGLLDEGYFMYFEEVDFCRRAAAAGWPCWYAPDSRVVHLVGQSSGVADQRERPRPMPDYWFDSRRRYFLRNHGLIYALWADAMRIGGAGLAECRRRLGLQHDPLAPPPQVGQFIRHSALCKITDK